ncbi:40S ribosome biogenesis GTP-binding protein [Encephalitozoon hellem ATCC 50504]|uniref:Ribosome biogenesis protein Bms1 n=1 Tax=Encephalitozoon hellem TaxID=27973 RepID=A0A9Q9C6A5_ENCHE|nr:40S ribosome biogenesis GTP-binding protein [Encephalitozoon hellem ATCC 50504]AFM98409.1 40S ribosome biogenesis GTP-binding protein [Encephalitozoon hellem ATCC 50504]UTX43332.1 ribosome biogenesis protein Bms1 [Encephalitozoon hellem]|eukprot:XP_003887390.1 40S ribosome biogenesis GTP-binding protein [Encephalitozoon hellem ATCC 50504]
MNEKTGAKKSRRMTNGQLRHEEKIARVPIENMFYKDLPPAFVSIVGPSRSGKTTLMRSIVKYFTHQLIDTPRGPVTLSSSKEKRITLFESRADIHQFVDISKVSDLVILTINAASGLEMETFEFLTLLISHGLSKILCVVTNADGCKDQKHLKSIKKRIWEEICPGIKFFYVGEVEAGRYRDADFSKLCRSIGVMKYRPIEWKCMHPHVVVDRVDEVFVYGYVRGGLMRKDTEVHIPGIGDNRIVEIEAVIDPVPSHGESKLSQRSKILYSPMSEINEHKKEEVEEENGVEIEIEEDMEVKIFRGGKSIEERTDCCVSEGDTNEEGSEEEEEEEIEEKDESSLDFEDLKKMTSDRFQREAVTEEDLIEKFNRRYEEKEKENSNILLREKRRLEEEMKRNEEMMVPGVIIPGKYVKIRLNSHIPRNVDFNNVIILGSFLVAEKEMNIIQGKVKRYKWYRKILKTNEPAIFSVGWRRFQSVPIFSMKDATRNRVIKYTPESMHCNISFYGPVVPAGTGFSVYSEKGDFRVLGLGTITDVNGDPNLVKKLKLIGYPKEIRQNTVFVQDMFTSDLEVLKFQGASLKAVSGLRGQVKMPHGKNGVYRATFEGNMLMSDIITLRCFVPVDVYKIFVPVNNLVGEWRGLRRLHEIREALGIAHNYGQEDSSPGEEEECDAVEEDYGLPQEIEKELPFDRRRISIVSEKIELPIPPDLREKHKMMNSIMEERVKKDREEEENRQRLRRMKEDEIRRKEKEREKRVKKTIHDNHKDMMKKRRKKR